MNDLPNTVEPKIEAEAAPTSGETGAPVKSAAPVVKAPAPVEAKSAPVAAKAVPAKTAAVKSVAKPVAKRTKKKLVAKAAAKPASKPVATTPVVKAVAKAVSKATSKTATAPTKRKYVRKSVAAVVAPVLNQAKFPLFKGSNIMDTTNAFAGFTQVPGAEKFQTMFADVGAKGQDAVRKTQLLAEQMSEAAKANMEAVVESGRIAAAGARDLGTEIVATTKSGVEHATAAVKTLAEAKSPTEFFQLQSDMFRASFDRMVADGSKITEHMVKLAGEAVQPLSSRASVNAEKFSELTAA
ncbi:phasin family protein [Sphingomonas sp. RB1R13]|uniref:phasin family protein n=1 Tax=Sphingomonas sp. RB1R13 TaxID=3096159 RepID=UPI002FC8A4CE